MPTELADRVRNAPKVQHPSYSDSLLPDFGALFPLVGHTGVPGDTPEWPGDGYCDQFEHDGCANCSQVLTPRLADLLHTGVEIATDVLRMHVEWVTYPDVDLELGSMLPPPVLRHLAAIGEIEAGRWLGSFIATLSTVAARLEAGEEPTPRSTAEEMALHIVIEYAEGYLIDTIPELDAGADTRTLFPATGEDRDDDLGRVRDVLFEDHDVLMLFDPSLDGIEDPTSDAAVRLDLANLHARDWFTPFRDTSPVPAFAPPEPDGPVRMRLGDDLSVEQALLIAQDWLDTVARAGTATGVAFRSSDTLIVTVAGLPLKYELAIHLNRSNDRTWEVYGVVTVTSQASAAGASLRHVYSRSDVDRYWVGDAAA